MLARLSRAAVGATRAATAGKAQRAFRVSAPLRAVEESDRPWYVLGVSLADHLGDIKPALSDAEKKAISAGFNDRFVTKADMEVLMKASEYGKMATDLLAQRNVSFGGNQSADKVASHNLVVEAAKEEGAIQTQTGLVIKHHKEGEGLSPTVQSMVTVHYTGTLANGKVFDDSRARGEPATFPLEMLIPGWQEGIMMMRPGGSCKMTLPSNLAYGPQGAGGVIPPDAALVFEVELIEFTTPEA